MRSVLLNWKHWTDSAAIFVNFVTYHGTILISHRILAKLFADFCQIRHCFQICHFWRGPSWHFIEYSKNRWRIFAMFAFRHILLVIIFSSYCWQNFVKFVIFVVVWISGHRCLWAQNLATLEQVVYLFCLLFSNLPHYTNPLNTRKKIEINKLLCPGNPIKTRGLYNIRFPHKRDKKRKS